MDDEAKTAETPDNVSNSLDRLNKVVNEMHELVYPQPQENKEADTPMPNSKIDSVRMIVDRNIDKLHDVRNALRRL